MIIAAVLAALAYGVSDFTGGLVSRRIKPLVALAWGEPAGAVVVAVSLIGDSGRLDLHIVLLSAASGVAGLVGLGLMYRLMATEPLNQVAPVTAVLAAGLPVLFGILGGEHPGLLAWSGIAVGVMAIWLVSTEGSGSKAGSRLRPAVVVMALGSGAGFGCYFVLIAEAGHDSGMVPLLVARLASMVLIAMLFGHRRLTRSGRQVPGADVLALDERPAEAVRGTAPARYVCAAMAAGMLDAAADVAFLIAARTGHLSFAGVICSLYPAVTVLLAMVVLRERNGWRPCAGLALSALSLALIAG